MLPWNTNGPCLPFIDVGTDDLVNEVMTGISVSAVGGKVGVQPFKLTGREFMSEFLDRRTGATGCDLQ